MGKSAWTRGGKLGVFVILSAAAAAVGVYVGHSLSEAPQAPVFLTLEERPVLADMPAGFVDGEAFPDVAFEDEDGNSGAFAQLFDGRPTVFFFWSLGCGPCAEQAAVWDYYIAPNLIEGVKTMVCVDHGDRDMLGEYRGECEGKTVLLVDMDWFKSNRRIHSFPTIVSVDGSGAIMHVQVGHGRFMDAEFLALTTLDATSDR